MTELKKVLKIWDSMAINIAIAIGVGIFIVPAEVAKYLHSPDLIMLVWLVGGIISLLGALCYAELSSSFPKTGGNYIYLKESYGPLVGFLFGWTELLVVRTGSIAAVAFIFAEYTKSFLSMGDFPIKAGAISIVAVLSLVNIVGLKYGKKIQTISVAVKLLAMAGLVVFGVIFQKGALAHFSSGPMIAVDGILPLFGLALIPVLWTYGGWQENTFVAEETEDAAKTLPLALIAGASIITIVYLLMNLLYIYLLPKADMASSGLIGTKALQILFGQKGGRVFDALIIISSVGCLNAMIITGSRVTYAMSKDSAIFRFIGKADTKHGTPARAIIINAVWSVVLVILGAFNILLFFTGIMVWLFFALTGGGIFILRRKFPGMKRPYKVWGYPLLPIIFILVCVALFINTMAHYPMQSLAGISLTLIGIPLFIISKKIERNRKQNEECTDEK